MGAGPAPADSAAHSATASDAGAVRRYAAVLLTGATGSAPPPGVDPAAYADALAEDACEIASGLRGCDPAVGAWAPDPAEADRLAARAERLTWPGTPVLALTGDDATAALMAALHARGADQAAVIAADAPDLPPLIMGKLFRALGHADMAVSAAPGGGLAALAARLPLPSWAPPLDLDAPGILARLLDARPDRRSLAEAPSWHRLRAPADLEYLDAGLEGWECTRALLEGVSLH